MCLQPSREWTQKVDGEKKKPKGERRKPANFSLLRSHSIWTPSWAGYPLPSPSKRAKINLSKPRSPHEWTWYVSFGTSTIDPFSTTLELLQVPNIFSYLKRRWRSETDRTKCIKRLSHKKFNTTNNSKGLNGRVVTGTQVSLEFLQINSTTMWQCAQCDVGDWIKSVVWLKDLL